MFSLHVERALRLQALEEAAAHAADRGRRGWRWARARTPARSTVGDGWVVRVQGRVAQPPVARSSRFRARRPASAGSCATSSRSARGRSRCSTRCASASRTSARSRYLLDHAVGGIGHYGNSIGVPTIGGEVYFEGPYEQNCLVNAMALGLARADGLIRSAAAGRRQRADPVRRLDRARRDRRRVGARLGRARRRGRVQAPDGPGRRPVRGEEAAWSARSSCSTRGLLVALQDLGAAGLSSSSAPRWRPRARSASTSTSRACRCARPAWSRSRSWSPSRRSGCSASRARARRRGARRLREVGGARRPRSARSPTDARAAGALRRRQRRRRDAGRGARRRLPAVRPRARRRRPAGSTRRRRDAGRRGSIRDDAARAARARRTSPRAGRCSSSTTASSQSRTVRRPEQADAAVLALPDGGGDRASRSTATAAASRATRTRGTVEAVLECAANLACVGRRAARPDELPELRQPREAAHRLAADRVDPRPRPTRAARSACRSSAATSRSTTRAATGRSTRRRSSAWSASCPTRARAGRSAFAREGDAIALVAGRSTPSLAGSRAGEAARRGAARRPARDRHRRRCGPRRRRSATRCAPGDLASAPRRRRGRACSSRSPSAAWPAASAPHGRPNCHGGEARLFGEAPGGFVVSGEREALERLAQRCRSISSATVGGDALVVGGDGPGRWPSCARPAHSSLAALFP